jgi:hypothetical protein
MLSQGRRSHHAVTDLTSLLLVFVNVGKNAIALPLSIQRSQELTFWH